MHNKATRDTAKPFEKLAAQYDKWFDSEKGRAVFAREAACLESLISVEGKRWLEVGVGTGRFAKALGVPEGMDPSSAMLEIASKRGILTRKGYGEELPYPDGVFDGVLMVTILCFLSEPERAFIECSRVLVKNGCLVLGFVPSESPWSRLYMRKGDEGHPFYSCARFYTREQVLRMAHVAGFVFKSAASCLFSGPEEPLDDAGWRQGLIEGAGFTAMKFIVNKGKGNKAGESDMGNIRMSPLA
jgi:ubiquinone/menaquinone biosynthesis C-methylase UbiE